MGIALFFVFLLGCVIGVAIGTIIEFDWKAFFEYKKEMQEMRLKLATDYLDKEGGMK